MQHHVGIMLWRKQHGAEWPGCLTAAIRVLSLQIHSKLVLLNSLGTCVGKRMHALVLLRFSKECASVVLYSLKSLKSQKARWP